MGTFFTLRQRAERPVKKAVEIFTRIARFASTAAAGSSGEGGNGTKGPPTALASAILSTLRSEVKASGEVMSTAVVAKGAVAVRMRTGTGHCVTVAAELPRIKWKLAFPDGIAPGGIMHIIGSLASGADGVYVAAYEACDLSKNAPVPASVAAYLALDSVPRNQAGNPQLKPMVEWMLAPPLEQVMDAQQRDVLARAASQLQAMGRNAVFDVVYAAMCQQLPARK